MRTVVPPQFSGEDLQQLLVVSLAAGGGAGDRPRPAPDAAQGAPVEPLVAPRPEPVDAPPSPPADPWDEPW
ncbi:hypothetical protein ABT297_17195 [Dactylosporangium sp. NPDC000555]|uniref:hypothetical protein n=1 Tax=Dactylosporangium sp. NPDC000555 TaxID=3154260 RepID=UPI00331D438C